MAALQDDPRHLAFVEMCRRNADLLDPSQRSVWVRLAELCEREAFQIERSIVQIAESRRLLAEVDALLKPRRASVTRAGAAA